MRDQMLNRMTDAETVFPAGPPGGRTRAARGGKDFIRNDRLAVIR
ncbi:hypothetical protein [Maliponia aquimaris]|uniref:Uncharacterized protein n=1 Tax=Maliponia aquimaris TaxID=1673631 RepID=A0A238L5Y1_9RHOB|nr:hypothetical protein [Maliponia aquimaris]SMX50407.1 hypothetical protein MAA8898_04766 [Maliponia aquimaris]